MASSKPAIAFNRRSYEGLPVQIWTDGRVTLGSNHAYAGKAAKERKVAEHLQAWAETYTVAEIRKMCETGIVPEG